MRKLNGKWASWNTEKFPELPENKRFMCFVAQDLKKVLPDLVEKDPSTQLYRVDDQISPLLVEAVKEVDNEIVTLKQKVKAVEYERDELARQVHTLGRMVTQQGTLSR